MGNIMNKKFLASAAAVALVIGAPAAAFAVPVTYTQSITNVQGGRLAGATIPTGSTVTISANADTANITAGTAAGAAGSCVLTTSPTVRVGAGTAVAITQPIYACVRTNGSYAGFYTTNSSNSLTQGLSVAYLPTSFSLNTLSTLTYGAGDIHTHNEFTGYGAGVGFVSVTGGDYAANAEVSNTSASTLTAAAAAAPAIPTMTEWAMILFGMILAGGAALYLQRRRMLGV